MNYLLKQVLSLTALTSQHKPRRNAEAKFISPLQSAVARDQHPANHLCLLISCMFVVLDVFLQKQVSSAHITPVLLFFEFPLMNKTLLFASLEVGIYSFRNSLTQALWRMNCHFQALQTSNQNPQPFLVACRKTKQSGCQESSLACPLCIYELQTRLCSFTIIKNK